MTRPLSYVRERIILALMREGRFPTQRDLCVAAGLIKEPLSRNESSLRIAQRTVQRLIKAGIIKATTSPQKVDNVYVLTPAGKTIAATLYADAITRERQRHTESAQHVEHPS